MSTGISRQAYRAAVRERSGIEWHCQSCRGASDPKFNDLPVAESTRIDDNPIHTQSNRNSSEVFNNPLSEESNDWSGGNPSDESSLDDPSIHEQDSSFALTYEIVEQSTKRGRKKLIDSRGYTYNVQRQRGDITDWQCTVRRKVNPCKARITQRGVAHFQHGEHGHNHPAEVGAAMVARVTSCVKAKAVEDVFKSAAAIVDEVIITMPVSIAFFKTNETELLSKSIYLGFIFFVGLSRGA